MSNPNKSAMELAQEWKATQGRSTLDPHLEDYAVVRKQRGADKSARIAVVEDAQGGRSLYIVSTQPEALDAIGEAMQNETPITLKLLKRPSEEQLAELLSETPFAKMLSAGIEPGALPPLASGAAPPAPAPKALPAPQKAAPRVAAAPAAPCRPEHTDPNEGIYVRVKSDRNQRLATSPLLPGVNAAKAWAREWNAANAGFPVVVEVVRDGRVYCRYDRPRSAFHVVP